ncbi:hypothetical protein [Streptomyces nanshensis]|uniref:Uncharacterized protein n=1 Tax=Streptomyces nanshensis TaxID=518642 RepID=A0A1E7LC53_9ACTN|nr:hypothetical protein [Streptomyces nanshensis]OEV13787.1 hypothetical protein AN218_01760 [Streptomyces nanshensis]
MYGNGYDDTVAVDVSALHVEGEDFEQLPRDRLLRLHEDTLGMTAGFVRTFYGPYTKGLYPGTLRDLEPVPDAEAAALIAAGTHVHDARRAEGWSGDFPVTVHGLRVGQLRAVLAQVDLPDDALVAIGAADFPDEGIGSPASTRVEVGYYRPDPARGLSGAAYGGEIDYAMDGSIPAHMPALVLNPTH